MEVVVDRDALYYPYIHIRDANWLKATLLSFPQVRRIVPQEFSLNDRPDIQAFRSVTGARGEPLLIEEPAYLYSAYQAQERLLKKLEASPPELLNRYTRVRAEMEYAASPNAFQMHAGKMQPLLEFLRANDMAWPTREISASNPRDWYALHPTLWEIVMSLIANSIPGDVALTGLWPISTKRRSSLRYLTRIRRIKGGQLLRSTWLMSYAKS